ncbi:hypothetical protein [Homoserinimonas hongtaonis]|uniref:Uncharacterized protein n=1 Tax=Homoserinimonas hongtaonis TaxID=2079791 RepID=A0A2U1SZD2_9MICO|nr:hypothetical protein [Salinibacterium hongtaonis]AWB89539.1 hypothetical protein C2138_08270 [Salinibacterium hongtaonis]PWB96981.1 hypothetical protein DF220_03360 [Salinibacterium hongtaonis]
MESRSVFTLGGIILALSLTGCAGTASDAGVAARSDPVQTSAPAIPETRDAAAAEQAQAWLDAANLPPGAVRSDASVAQFTSYTGWPCGPVEELEAFWFIPEASIHDTASWLMDHPTADLITTAIGPVSDDAAIDSAIVGYIPAPGSQEGIVYTITKMDDGVAVRAEVAAQAESATCPPIPDGGVYGAPGHG